PGVGDVLGDAPVCWLDAPSVAMRCAAKWVLPEPLRPSMRITHCGSRPARGRGAAADSSCAVRQTRWLATQADSSRVASAGESCGALAILHSQQHEVA